MGKFTYDSSVSTGIDDRALAHLQAVILSKVRRGEAFPFTWKDDERCAGVHPYGGATTSNGLVVDPGKVKGFSAAQLVADNNLKMRKEAIFVFDANLLSVDELAHPDSLVSAAHEEVRLT